MQEFEQSYDTGRKKFGRLAGDPNFAPGEVAEWSIAAVLKTVEGYTSGGSNPSLSARPNQCTRSFAAGFLFEVRERSEPYEREGRVEAAQRSSVELARSGSGKTKNESGLGPPEGALAWT
jgi:hypothetical protein